VILADLRTAPLALLERYMGRADANEFLSYQNRNRIAV